MGAPDRSSTQANKLKSPETSHFLQPIEIGEQKALSTNLGLN